MKETVSVLIVDDCVVTSVALGRVIEHALPGCRIVRAQSCFEMHLLQRVYEFSLFVIDVHLPDGCGLDLIPPILAQKPDAGIIVLTADPQPEFRERARALGVQHFLSKPFRSAALEEAARSTLDIRTNEEAVKSFTATLKQLTVLDIVQLKCLSRVTTRLEVTSSDHDFHLGTVFIESGEIMHAEVRNDTTALLAEGEQAIMEILAWRAGRIAEIDSRPSDRRTIHRPWQLLLLDAASRADEPVARERQEDLVPAG